MVKKLDLSIVAKRLKEYDTLSTLWAENVGYGEPGQAEAGLKQCEEAGNRVREAFADATSDRNSRDKAMLINVGGHDMHNPSWLRQMLQKDKLYHGLRCLYPNCRICSK